jgi:hypothetical protein
MSLHIAIRVFRDGKWRAEHVEDLAYLTHEEIVGLNWGESKLVSLLKQAGWRLSPVDQRWINPEHTPRHDSEA